MFIIRILFLIALSGFTHAQSVTYNISIPIFIPSNPNSPEPLRLKSVPLGEMVVTYSQNGYVTERGGQISETKIEPTGDGGAIMKMSVGSLTILTIIGRTTWYHDQVGVWQTGLVTTTSNEVVGEAKMYYVGPTESGRLYREILRINNRVVSESETLVDHNDHIIWSEGSTLQGRVRMERQ